MNCRESMYLALSFLLLSVSVASAERNDQQLLTPGSFDNFRDVSDPQVSPDGNWVAYTVTSVDADADEYLDTVWMVNWDGAKQIQLTYGPDSASNPRWSPDGTSLAFLSARGGTPGGSQVWAMDRAGGEARQLTRIQGSVSDYAWSPDSSRLALVATLSEKPSPGKSDASPDKHLQPIVIDRFQFKNDADGYVTGSARARVYLYDLDTGNLDALTQDESFDEFRPTWSPDGQKIAFVSNRDVDPDRTANTDVFVAEAKPASEVRRITIYEGQDTGPIAWSNDGRFLAYIQGPLPKFWLYEFSQVAIVALDGGAPVYPTSFLNRDTGQPRFSDNGRSLDVIVTDNRSQYAARVPVKGDKLNKLTAESQVVSRQSRGRQHVAILLSTPGVPAEIFALEGGQPRKLTTQNDEWIAGIRFASVEAVNFPSTDGTEEIGALITKPPNFRAGQKYPTILWIHGGPYGQDDFGFDFERQLFAANGYVVVQVNYRGSSGRGAEFGQSIFADWGNKDTADVIAGIDHAIQMGVADPERLGVGGWSQGGIITNYVIASDTRFKAAISGAGAGNQLALFGSDQYAFFYENEFGPPWENPDLWIKLSYPFFHADRIKTPTFYLGGDKDFNVPIIGGEQMYQALKLLGIPTQLVVYPGEHHSFSRPGLEKDIWQRYLAWYSRYL